jgi:exodeoxyribonuclease VII large subunit
MRRKQAAESRAQESGLLFPEGEQPELREGHPVYTVTQAVVEAKALVETAYPGVYVRGEVTDFRGVHTSGHMYFRINDEDSVLEVAFFRGANRKLGFTLENGMEIIVFGRLSIYGRSSRFQIIAEFIEPAGLGALQARIEQLKKKLEAEGLFAQSRKRPIPEFPHSIAVVTSVEGAAIKDFLKVTRERFPGQHITIFPAMVQGEDAARMVVEGIEAANDMRDAGGRVVGFDVLVVCRGGGSIEDLMAFNDEGVARAIASSDIPVVTGIGHERDITIADLVADLRAATPSQAAELVTPDRADLADFVADAGERMVRQVRGAVEDMAQALDDAREELGDSVRDLIEGLAQAVRECRTRVVASAPEQVLVRQREAVEQAAGRAGQAVARRLGEAKQRTEGAAGRLNALSPLGVLERGYAIAFALPGREVVKDPAQVAPGSEVEVRVRRGIIRAGVKSVEKKEG